jgi:hypothetical protein
MLAASWVLDSIVSSRRTFRREPENNTFEAGAFCENCEVVKRISGRNVSKAEIVVVEHDDRTIAVKDFSNRPWFVRNTIGRLFIRRESAVYSQLGTMPGIPQYLGRIGPFSLATEWVDGFALADVKGSEVDPQVLDKVDTIVSEMHRRGVALGDLHRGDVLVSEPGEVFLIDFATALRLGPRPGFIRRRLFDWMKAQDHIATARIRAWASGKKAPQNVEGVGAGAAKWYARGRRLKRVWDWLRGRHR